MSRRVCHSTEILFFSPDLARVVVWYRLYNAGEMCGRGLLIMMATRVLEGLCNSAIYIRELCAFN